LLKSRNAPELRIEACTLYRLFADSFLCREWTLDRLLQMTEEAVTFAVSEGLPVMFVTEDTTRADPETLRALYTTAIRCGARPSAFAIRWATRRPTAPAKWCDSLRGIIDQQGEKVRLDWHGQSGPRFWACDQFDRRNSGRRGQVHGSALGMGERVGNTPMDQLLVNLKLMGWIDKDLPGWASTVQPPPRLAAGQCR
jgi:2-isopropylmalate synthase